MLIAAVPFEVTSPLYAASIALSVIRPLATMDAVESIPSDEVEKRTLYHLTGACERGAALMPFSQLAPWLVESVGAARKSAYATIGRIKLVTGQRVCYQVC